MTLRARALILVLVWLAACAQGVLEEPSQLSAAQPSSGAAGSGAVAVHAHGAATASATGPFIDESAIPVGERGNADVRIRGTSEMPAQGDGTGAFRTECGFSHMNFDDPIVFPGMPGMAHLHAYFGNTLTDADSTPESLRESGNSTCRGGTANRTAYWVPALIDAAGHPIAPKQLDAYYKSGYGGVAPQDITPFPSGLRMLAGDPKATAKQSHAYWGCLGNYTGKKASIPECGAGKTILMIVEFPQCWDGENLDSSDHRSHMAYPGPAGCPASHPVSIPAISFNVHYVTPAQGAKGLRLASDMYDAAAPGGFSAHGDWFEAWDPDVVKAFVKGCDNAALDCHSHLLGDGRMIF